MKAHVIRIDNSCGIRIPQEIVGRYGERRDGILLRPVDTAYIKISWETPYSEMAAEAEEAADWSAWGATVGDGIND